MKKLVFSTVMIALVTAASFAQPALKHQKGGQHHGNKHNRKHIVMQELNLSDAQKAEMKASRADYSKQLQAINKNENQTVKQLRDQRAALAQAQKAKMESILTPDQKATVSQARSQAMASQKERGAKHIDRMKQRLQLTDQQMATLKQQQDATRTKMQALKTNDKLDATAKRAQFKALHEEMRNNFASVLTKEQKDKMQTNRQGMKGRMNDRRMQKNAAK